MERRNRSLKALKELQYIDSLESDLKANSLLKWTEKYLTNSSIEQFDLELSDLKILSELFYKNIIFIKQHRIQMKEEIDNHRKIREFLKH